MGHEGAASRGDAKLNLPIHVNGGASLALLEKTELGENFRSLKPWQVRGVYTVPFETGISTLTTVDAICNEESPEDGAPWSSKELEVCVYRLSSSDRADYMHDLVRLLVSRLTRILAL